MSNFDAPIQLTMLTGAHPMAGNYYANVMGVHPRNSVGVYIAPTGAIVAHTIREGRMAAEWVAKLHAEVTRRGVTFPDQHNLNNPTTKEESKK